MNLSLLWTLPHATLYNLCGKAVASLLSVFKKTLLCIIILDICLTYYLVNVVHSILVYYIINILFLVSSVNFCIYNFNLKNK